MQQFSDRQISDARTRFDIIASEQPLKRAGREFRGVCPFHNEKTPSFYVCPDKGFYHCFGCGAHGDVIAYVMQLHGLKFTDAVRHILDLPEQRPTRQGARVEHVSAAEVDRKVEEELLTILEGCGPITDRTPAFIYLHLRGIDPSQPGLFYHPSLECWELGREDNGEVRKLPAIVAPITNSADEITAILRTWLTSSVVVDRDVPKDNRAPLKTRKKGLGVMGDGAVRLAEAADLFGLAEGWETACSARRLYNLPVWATCGTARFGFPGHWRQRNPKRGTAPKLWFLPDEPGPDDDAVWLDERPPTVWLPPEARRVVVFGDNGTTGRIVANHAVKYWRREGIKAFARFPDPKFSDFNDQAIAATAASA